MRIAQLAPLIESVPPHGYGGTELVVSLLTEELVKLGHDVTLFATADSVTQAKLVAGAPTGIRAAGVPVHRWSCYELQLIISLVKQHQNFDIIHNHLGFYALPFLQNLNIPVVSTNHNPIMEHCRSIYLEYKDQPYVSISQAYQKFNCKEDLNYVGCVYNGIDTTAFQTKENPTKDFLLFIGRICKAKGTREAIEIARRVGKKLIIAGKVDPADERYYNTEVKDLIDGEQIKFIGEVNFEQKLKLYQDALAVIYPIAFEEPFGLVMAEAMATGTPVLALDRGSVREVLSDKETAVIGNSVEELIQRFSELESIDRSACVNRAKKLFGKEQMAKEYEAIYSNLILQHRSQEMLDSIKNRNGEDATLLASVNGNGHGNGHGNGRDRENEAAAALLSPEKHLRNT